MPTPAPKLTPKPAPKPISIYIPVILFKWLVIS